MDRECSELGPEVRGSTLDFKVILTRTGDLKIAASRHNFLRRSTVQDED